jgi:tryptophanyl-tRNA synthetase
MKRLMADPAYVDSVLKDGAERARVIAEPIIRDVKETVGFLVD